MWIDGTEDFCHALPARDPPVNTSWHFVDDPLPGIVGGIDHGSYEIFIEEESSTSSPSWSMSNQSTVQAFSLLIATVFSRVFKNNKKKLQFEKDIFNNYNKLVKIS